MPSEYEVGGKTTNKRVAGWVDRFSVAADYAAWYYATGRDCGK